MRVLKALCLFCCLGSINLYALNMDMNWMQDPNTKARIQDIRSKVQENMKEITDQDIFQALNPHERDIYQQLNPEQRALVLKIANQFSLRSKMQSMYQSMMDKRGGADQDEDQQDGSSYQNAYQPQNMNPDSYFQGNSNLNPNLQNKFQGNPNFQNQQPMFRQ